MSSSTEIRSIAIDLIVPGRTQARRWFDAERLAELASSIKESGLVQPVVVRRRGREFELLAGERRWRAAQLAGLHELPAIVRDDLGETEAHVLGLIENLQRETLSPLETAEGLQRLGEAFDLTHEAIGTRVGKSRAYVTNFLRLLSLADEVRAAVDNGTLSLGHAKVLAGLTADQQIKWSRLCLRDQLTVRALEKRLTEKVPKFLPDSRQDEWTKLAQKLAEQLGYPAEFLAGAKGAGELRLRFHSLDELDGLLARIGYREN